LRSLSVVYGNGYGAFGNVVNNAEYFGIARFALLSLRSGYTGRPCLRQKTYLHKNYAGETVTGCFSSDGG
jgi:hypothetical protein